MSRQSKRRQIKTINSESQIQQGIIENFKKYRVIDQIACYLGNGTDRFYNTNRTTYAMAKTAVHKYDYSKVVQLLHNVLTKKSGIKVAIVSLGCGSCETDKVILKHLQEMGGSFAFFGVDSSMDMLYKANSILDDTTFKTQLICADFGASGFKKELDKVIEDYDIGIYLFFGNTLGNLNQGYITDILESILNTGDYLLLDASGFETMTTPIQAKLFERYKGYLDNPTDVEFYLGPLKDLGIPEDHGKLVLEITKDNATQAQVFTFGFKVHTAIKINLEGEKVNLTPNEYVYLYKILIYDLSELTKFLETKEFKLKDTMVGEYANPRISNQLLLQRQ